MVRMKSLFSRNKFLSLCSVYLMCLNCLNYIQMCSYLIKPQHTLFLRWSVDADVQPLISYRDSFTARMSENKCTFRRT
jgi:hypothetical protein